MFPSPNPPEYNRGMSEQPDKTADADFDTFVSMPLGLLVVIGFLATNPGLPSEYSGPAALIVGVTMIYQIVRWINRRDEPRWTRRPPDVP